MEAAGPMDGRATIAPVGTSSMAAPHRTLEIPPGFPQLPQELLLDFYCNDVKFWIGLGDLDP